jgi:hypothetical protein
MLSVTRRLILTQHGLLTLSMLLTLQFPSNLCSIAEAYSWIGMETSGRSVWPTNGLAPDGVPAEQREGKA